MTSSLANNDSDSRTLTPVVRSVQWLRYVAAALVVLYHTEVQIMRLDSSATHAFGIGAAGVDLFFVISGFVMVHATRRNVPTFGTFMKRRLLRIVPLYWFFTAVVALLILLWPQLFNSTVFYGGHFLASLAFVPYPHPVDGVMRPLLVPGWTLNAEMFFYLCFGALLGLSLERRILLIAAGFATLAAIAYFSGGRSGLISFYGAPLMLEFVAGMAVAWLVYRQQPLSVRLLAVVSAIAVLFTAAGIAQGISEHTTRFIYWGVAATCLLFVCLSIERRLGWIDAPTLMRLGDASYSIYLSHLFVLAFAGKLIAYTGLYSVIGSGGTRLVMLALASYAGLMIYDWIERPMQTFLGRWLAGEPARRARIPVRT